ncbi:hypothetical protein M431DRAFT_527659 [Trichoderma harzianum CBS 226.95]|uniref:Aminoglycoside phosphotransferase domain-containing protein n=1 Tax=Trichoderma harzianum CBS 226.95 TaxID=983964 RepID=A0A2T4APW2_TRIHA|nr:hypothetical protein M431DRAFT_527659 [Trichoderma harzianum CBS 226.95]PTB59070.1 hypothetical protein M431DRAFT_527659 [Trichoderma harzianum CBS 226.95]
MAASKSPGELPSKRWTSFDVWNYNGMKERLQTALIKIDKSALIHHAQRIKGQELTMSEPFSAGQYWICFEMVAEDKSIVIARVRLPRHPDIPVTVSEEDVAYSIGCAVAAMEFIRLRLNAVSLPRVYACEGMGSRQAAIVGAPYMLIEGFYGNTLQDVEFDICDLPILTQEHIIAQWTTVQAELATVAYPQIGTICSVSETGDPIIGKLAAGELMKLGPFSRASDYFTALGVAATNNTATRLGAFVFLDIVETTDLFGRSATEEFFPFNHMDLGTQNILVDEHFDFVAIIDWEFAQTAPWQVIHYPMPFPLLSPTEEILRDPNHIAYSNFRDAERELEGKGRQLGGSFTTTVDSPASRIYACFMNIGRLPAADEDLVHEMAQLAFGLNPQEAEDYVRKVERRHCLSTGAT